ncbi:hypothetical protein KAU32_00330 [bacterium]|nr:hypothetical protein [bacterium]
MLLLTINIVLFLFAFVGVFFIGDRLTFYAKALSKVSNLGEAFIGTVLIATITSLPELSSGFSAIFIAHNPELMVADVFGSNFFNITILWSILVYIIIIKKKISRPSKEHNGTILLYSTVPLLLVVLYFTPFRSLGGLSIPTILFILLFPLVFKLYGRLESGDQSDFELPKKYKHLNKKKIIWVFVGLAMLIICLGIILGKTSDFIARFEFSFNGKPFIMGSSFVGALFLAISTSLPEVAVTFHSIFKYRSIDLAYGNILGSNLFNVIIFVIGDLFTFKTPLIATLGFGNRVVLSALFISSILFVMQERLPRWLKISFAVIAIGGYVFSIKLIFGH